MATAQAQTTITNPTRISIDLDAVHGIQEGQPGYIINYLIKLFPPTATDASGIPLKVIPTGRGTVAGNAVDFPSHLDVVDTGLYKVCMSRLNSIGESPCSFAPQLYLRLKEPTPPTGTRLGNE